MSPSRQLLAFALAFSAGGCSSSQIVFVPASSPGVLGYVSGRAQDDPAELEARVRAEARRRGAERVEIVDRSVVVGRGRVRETAYYSGVTRTRTSYEELGEVSVGYHRKVAVLYQGDGPPEDGPNPWTRRQEDLRRACPDLRATTRCIYARGAALDPVAARDGERAALCERGSASSCMVLGWEAKRAGDRGAFLAYLTRACDELDGPAACRVLGGARAGLPSDARQRYADRAEMLEATQCAAGRVEGCPDEDRRRRRRCAAGQLEYCRELARAELADARPRRRAELLQQLERYCRWGMLVACLDLAGALPEPRASELAAFACARGSTAACERLDD